MSTANIQKEGTITFWLRHADPNWLTDGKGYDFGIFSSAGITVAVFKHPNKSLELKVQGPFNKVFDILETTIPPTDARGLFVALTWQGSSLNLYLNGVLVRTIPLPT